MFCAYTLSKKAFSFHVISNHLAILAAVFCASFPHPSIFSITSLLSLFLVYYVHFKQSQFFFGVMDNC